MAMDDNDLNRGIETLRLRYLQKNRADFVARATKRRLGAQEIIEELVHLELDEGKRYSVESRLKAARLGTYQPMSTFDWSWPKKINRDAIDNLFTLEFLKEPANPIFIGPAGVGKTMIAKNLVYQAVMKGHTGLCVDASKMLSELGEQESSRALERRILKYIKPSLLCIDEVGYLSYSTRAADLMFQVLSRRYENGATIVTTNSPFAGWDTIFPSAGCVSVMIDRLTHRAEILVIEAESWRRKEAGERQNRRKKPHSKKED